MRGLSVRWSKVPRVKFKSSDLFPSHFFLARGITFLYNVAASSQRGGFILVGKERRTYC
jgi:hypothetical protein